MSNKEQIPDNEEINKKNKDTDENQDAIPEIEQSSKENQEIVSLEEKMAEAQDKYLRLSAEFDNYRKRTLKERYDLIKTAGEDVIKGFLPIIDDFERALTAMETSEDINAVKEGVMLIYDKLFAYLKQKGLAEIEAMGNDFNTDYYEAVAKFATPEADKKGKVIDVVQKGYTLNEKVIRYSKVVVGE